MGWVCLALICHSSVEDNLERCVDSGILEEMNDHSDFFLALLFCLYPHKVSSRGSGCVLLLESISSASRVLVP